MSEKKIEDARSRLDLTRQTYAARFAGHPRVTRDAAILKTMANDLDAFVGDLAGHPELLKDLQAERDLYRGEMDAILQVQAAGPDAVEVSRLAAWAGFVSGGYRRHYAGQGRATRDLGRLSEMVSDLERCDRGLAALEAHVVDGPRGELDNARTTIASNIEMYQGERKAVAEARGAGALTEQSDVLAAVANEQFQLYQAAFAGKNRLSRRPATLARMVENLKGAKERMEALKAQGLHNESNDNNIGIVTGRIEAWTEELSQVRQVKQQTTFDHLVNALGEAANEVFEAYRASFAGEDRRTREPAMLSGLIDGLIDVARQMDDLDRVRQDEVNHKNQSIVYDHIRLYEREYTAIVDAKKAQATAEA